jgi:thymidine kinase
MLAAFAAFQRFTFFYSKTVLKNNETLQTLQKRCKRCKNAESFYSKTVQKKLKR